MQVVSGIEVQESEVVMVKFDSGHDDVGSGIIVPIESTQNHRKASTLQKFHKKSNLVPLNLPLCCFLNYRRNEKLLTSIGLPCPAVV